MSACSSENALASLSESFSSAERLEGAELVLAGPVDGAELLNRDERLLINKFSYNSCIL